MNICIRFYVVIVLMCLNVYSYSSADPCLDEADKISCIEAHIADLETSITQRIQYLNTTTGTKGEKGDKGLTGLSGVVGDQGPDMTALALQDAEAHRDTLDERYIDDVLKREVGEVSNDLRWLNTNVDDLWDRYSALNRNPDLIGVTKSQRSGNDYFDMPRQLGSGSQLSNYTVVKDGETCLLSLDNDLDDLERDCQNLAAENTIGSVCNITHSFLGGKAADYCNKVVSNNVLESTFSLPGIELDITDDLLDMLKDFSSSDTPIIVTSADEWSSYKLGLEPDDPVFIRALDNVLDQLEMTEVEDEVLSQLSLLSAEMNVLHANELTEGVPADEATENLFSRTEAINRSIALVRSLADPEANLRRERLAEYAMDSDMMYLVVLQSAIDNYIYFLTDVTFQSSLSEDEYAAFELFDAKFFVFAQKFLKRWQDIAAAEQRAYFVNYPATLQIGWPSTPNFVTEATTTLGEEYDFQQSEDIENLAGKYAALGITVGGVASTMAAASVATSALSSATGTAVGIYSAFSGSILSSSALAALGGTAGAVSVAAGPASILVVALTIGVVASVDFANQTRKDMQYDALMDFKLNSPLDLLAMSYGKGDERVSGADVLANMVYAWLMISVPRGVSNNEDL